MTWEILWIYLAKPLEAKPHNGLWVLFLLIVKAYPDRLQELKTQCNHQNYHFPQNGGSVGPIRSKCKKYSKMVMEVRQKSISIIKISILIHVVTYYH